MSPNQQSTKMSDVSSCKSSTRSLRVYSSPQSRNHLVKQALKAFNEMKDDQHNQISRLSMRFELIQIILASQTIYFRLNKLIKERQNNWKQKAFQQIAKYGVDYSSFFKTPQRGHSPGLISEDIGMEKMLHNQQLLKIIQEQHHVMGVKQIKICIDQLKKLILKGCWKQIQTHIRKKEMVVQIQQIVQKQKLILTLRCFNKYQERVQIQKLKAVNNIFQILTNKLNKSLMHGYSQIANCKKKLQIQINGVPLIHHYKNIKLEQALTRLCYNQAFQVIKIYDSSPTFRSNMFPSLRSLGETQSRQMTYLQVPPDTSNKLDESVQVEIEDIEDIEDIVEIQKPETEKLKLKKGKLQISVKQYLNQFEYQHESPTQVDTVITPIQKINLRDISQQCNENVQSPNKSWILGRIPLLIIVFIGIPILISEFIYLI